MSDWRERAALSISEAARLLSMSPSHVRRHFPLVRVAGVPRVRVADLLSALGEPGTAPETGQTPPTNRKADQIVGRILARRG